MAKKKQPTIKADRRSGAERLLSRAYTVYANNKPQLFKDFPILDPVSPVVEYVTGKGDANYPVILPVGKMGALKSNPTNIPVSRLQQVGVEGGFKTLPIEQKNPILNYFEGNNPTSRPGIFRKVDFEPASSWNGIDFPAKFTQTGSAVEEGADLLLRGARTAGAVYGGKKGLDYMKSKSDTTKVFGLGGEDEEVTLADKVKSEEELANTPAAGFNGNSGGSSGAAGAFGMITSMMGTAASMSAAAKAHRISKANSEFMESRARYNSDYANLDNFDLDGTPTSYYKTGGSFINNVRKIGNLSNFKPIAKNVYEVTGPSHEYGGVKMGDKEVEGGEVIKVTPNSTKVLSDRSEFFGYSPADEAKANPNTFEQEFAMQEASKPSNLKGGKKAIWGSMWQNTNTTEDGNPDENVNEEEGYQVKPMNYFLDNLTNFATTLATPNPMAPALVPNVNLNTDWNVEPQVTNVKNNERNLVNYFDKNISDANVRTALRIGAGNTSTKDINALRSEEMNKERDLMNQETMANLNVNVENTGRINSFRDAITTKKLGVLNSLNENAANMQRDLVDIEDKKNFYNLDLEKMKIELAKDTEGVLTEVLKSGGLDKYLVDGKPDLSSLNEKDAKIIKERTARYNQRRNGNK